MRFTCPFASSVSRLSSGFASCLCTCVVAGSFFSPVFGRETRQTSGDPFGFFRPWIALTQDDRERLDRGQVVVRILPAERGELAVFATSALDAGPDRLATRMRAIEDLKKSPFVLAIRRLSEPPILDDLAELSLDQVDLEAIRRCRPGACGLKLAAAEMQALSRVAEEAGPTWRDALQVAFRRLVLERVTLYRSQGMKALPSSNDRQAPVWPQVVSAALVQRSPYLIQRLPALAAHLDHYPHAKADEIESFLYWSKERFGGKPTVSVTHVSILQTPSSQVVPAVLVTGRQIFATHYMNGALSVTTVLEGPTGSSHYLAYVNRTQIDVLGGLFGPVKRAIIEGRIRRETVEIFQGLRRRLETGS